MYWAILGFAVGVWACQQLAGLPATSHLGLLAALLVPLAAWAWRGPRGRVLALAGVALLCGFAWAAWRAELRAAEQLAASLEGQDVVVSGYIADLPDKGERGQRFLFVADVRPAGVPPRLLLNWYGRLDDDEDGADSPSSAMPRLRAGERWRLTVRLHRPHGNFNPHGFDYEAWLFERGIRAVGYVRPKGERRRLEVVDVGFMPHLQHARQVLRERFARALPDGAYAGVLSALAVGDQAAITDAQWRLFRETGVTHLMSISGLHVTLFATLVGGLCGWAWRRAPWLCLRWPAQHAAILAGLAAAFLYTLLAGFGVPAQRTLYMLAAAALAMLTRRDAGILRSLSLALLLVLLIDPWAVLAAGFWLSFGAVACLALAAGGAFAGAGWLRAWLGAQWAILLLSVPMLLGIFQQFSLVSPLANALAIPLVSAVITPLAILFALCPLPSLAEFAHWLLTGLMWGLDWLASLPISTWQQAAPPGWLVALAVLLAGWALLPRGTPGRLAALAVLPPLLMWTPLRPVEGAFRLVAVDVGQGLALHVQTRTHDLLYDAGPAWGSPPADSGERVLIPYLRAMGVPRLDMLVVSHADIDHAGGAVSLLTGWPVQALRDSLPSGHPAHASGAAYQPCVAGEGWEWDGVRFEFLHPDADFRSRRDNDMSCVLRVSSIHGAALLTGDIERMAEEALLSRVPAALRADVIVAPHHGSNSSSHADFIAAVAPRVVVFTSGYRNRFGHPHAEVQARYTAAGATAYRSDRDGAVTIDFDQAGWRIETARHRARYWHGI